ncbi:hypothetical protein L1889_15150 [Paenalcaligenes niemegkensis]|uniref:alpha-ketoglutarate-dependent dioxygenase AlkB n=1 Tax=Paenalcaligenes niemegkensis TaxID=2895469 RepID=UPI001EE7F527|nr:alpha-ketoglutarate-dependent dioxygenase AlkB [Paenalcaligenes niemegkensis]MCQ9617843.1 hypothetical protein [Paenalcaligenes niemegkensis]
MTFDLFANSGAAEPEFLTPHTVLFPGYLLGEVDWLYAELAALEKQFPFRSMRTPKGKMSVATTSWGPLGWTSDESGYRYTTVDPISQRHWPALPPGCMHWPLRWLTWRVTPISTPTAAW